MWPAVSTILKGAPSLASDYRISARSLCPNALQIQAGVLGRYVREKARLADVGNASVFLT